MRAHKPLRSLFGRTLPATGGSLRTFVSSAVAIAASCLFLGSYIIHDQFAHPVNAQSVAIVAAASFLAVAAVLVFFLFQLCWRLKERNGGRNATIPPADWIALVARRVAEEQRQKRELPYQRVYRDHARIRQDASSRSLPLTGTRR